MPVRTAPLPLISGRSAATGRGGVAPRAVLTAVLVVIGSALLLPAAATASDAPGTTQTAASIPISGPPKPLSAAGASCAPSQAPNVAPGTDTSIVWACPAGGALDTPFRDVTRGQAHGQSIACAVAWGVVNGRTATAFAPTQAVTRAQVATMLAGLLDATGATLPSGPARRFPDVAGGPHAANIERLARAGIIDGGADGRFRPDAPVRRDQMASLLIRALDRGHGVVPPTSSERFSDVAGGPHATNVARLVGAGITRGTTPGRFEPAASVRRDQMATFVMRTASTLVEQGRSSVPQAVAHR